MYSIMVLNFFSSGISVTLIIFKLCTVLQYHLALQFAVFHPFG